MVRPPLPSFFQSLSNLSCTDNYEGDCFWEGLATRGIYEQYLYPKMSAEQKAFVVPGTFANADPNNASAIAPRGCTGFYPTASVQQTLPIPGGVQLNSFFVVHRNLDDAFVVKLRQYLMWTQQDRRIEVRAIHSSRFIRAVPAI